VSELELFLEECIFFSDISLEIPLRFDGRRRPGWKMLARYMASTIIAPSNMSKGTLQRWTKAMP
jgi:hypothetical protein